MPHDMSEYPDFRDPVELEQATRIARAWVELRRGARTVRLREFLYGSDTSLAQGQMDFLDVLVGGDLTMSALAEELRIDPSTATRAVQRLVDDGLAERFTSADDGRVVMVRASDEGRLRHADVADRRTFAMERILGAFDAAERATLAGLLDRFVDALDGLVSSLAPAEVDEPDGSATAGTEPAG